MVIMGASFSKGSGWEHLSSEDGATRLEPPHGPSGARGPAGLPSGRQGSVGCSAFTVEHPIPEHPSNGRQARTR